MPTTGFERRRLLRVLGRSAVLAAPAILARHAQAAEFTFKMATTIIPDQPLNARAMQAAAAILEETGGRVQIQVFPGYQLGSSTSVLSQLRGGAIEIATFSGSVLSTLVPLSTIYNVAFAFQDLDRVWTAMDGRLGDHIRAAIGRSGLHALDKHWNLGFRQITTSTRPVAAPADLRDMKLRVPVAPLFVSCFRALGAAPAPINFDELYTALQTKVVDGQENDLFQIQAARLYEVQRYCSTTNHIWDGYFTLVNGRVWRSLPSALQGVVAKHLDAAAVSQRQDLQERMEGSAQALRAAGIAFNEPDRDAFRTALGRAGFYAECKRSFGPEAWAILESSVGPLA